jgi:hypothetical protein
MKTKNLSYEANGISLAVKLDGVEKPVYMTPSQVVAFAEQAPALLEQLATLPKADVEAIERRAALDPESRKAARVAAGLAVAVKALTDAKTEGEREVAELKLQLFEKQNKVTRPA